MSLRFLLDTTIVSAPMARAPNTEILRRLGRHSHESAIAAPVTPNTKDVVRFKDLHLETWSRREARSS